MADFAFLKIDVVEHSRMVLAGRRVEVSKLLNSFEKFVEGVVKSQGGDIWNWQGDGGLCAFDAGRQLGNVENAMRAALIILQRVSPFHLSKEPFPEAKQQIRVRIAVHLGTADLHRNRGRIHSPDINFVAHLERKATPNSIIASEITLKECRKKIQEQFLDAGIFERKAVRICELYGVRRINTWEKILRGLGILFRGVQKEKFRPDLVIGCGRSAGIIGAVLAGNLEREAFVVLGRRREDKERRRIRFNYAAVLNEDKKVLPRRSKLLVCFYQISSGETADTFCSYLTDEAGFSKGNILIASLSLSDQGRRRLAQQGFRYVAAYEEAIAWGDTPWKLNDRWHWI